MTHSEPTRLGDAPPRQARIRRAGIATVVSTGGSSAAPGRLRAHGRPDWPFRRLPRGRVTPRSVVVVSPPVARHGPFGDEISFGARTRARRESPYPVQTRQPEQVLERVAEQPSEQLWGSGHRRRSA